MAILENAAIRETEYTYGQLFGWVTEPPQIFRAPLRVADDPVR
jgi:hypothetical protein